VEVAVESEFYESVESGVAQGVCQGKNANEGVGTSQSNG
jgi:hypothetical protein